MADEQFSFGLFGNREITQQDILKQRIVQMAQQAESQKTIAEARSAQAAAAGAGQPPGFFSDPQPRTQLGVLRARGIAGARRAGAAISRALQEQRRKDAPLTPRELRDIEIAQQAEENIRAIRFPKIADNASPQVRATQLRRAKRMNTDAVARSEMELEQKSIANFNGGNAQEGLRLATELGERRKARLNRRKLLADAASTERETAGRDDADAKVRAETDKLTTEDDLLEQKLDDIGIGGQGSFAVIDANNPDNPLLEAVQGRDGRMRDPSTGELLPSNFVKASAYAAMQEVLSTGGTSEKDRLASERSRNTGLITLVGAQKGLDKVRQRGRSVGQLGTITGLIIDDLTTLEQADIPAEAAISTAGKLNTFVDNISKTIVGVKGSFLATRGMTRNENVTTRDAVELGTVGKAGGDLADLDNLQNETLLSEYGALFDSIQVPEGLAEKAGVYKARIVRLAYAVARAQEPGARQLSDADFRHALDQLGASSGNPEVLAEVLLDLLTETVREHKQDVEEVITWGGLPGVEFGAERSLNTIYGRDPRKDFDFLSDVTARVDRFKASRDDTEGQPLGTVVPPRRARGQPTEESPAMQRLRDTHSQLGPTQPDIATPAP